MNDHLTGLPDRWQFLDLLRVEVNRANDNSTKLALLVVEIKNFQRINMLYRYSVGDQVLKSFADTLRQVARKQDFISRIGDCKFSLILVDIASEEHAKLAAYKIQRLLESVFEVEFERIRCSASIGVALSPMNATGSDELLKVADRALGKAKYSDQSIVVAENNIQDENFNELETELELLEAIEGSQFRVFFQPKISAKTGKPVGAEALIRWQHPTRGLLFPDAFLTQAETIGIMKPITSWMLNSALRLANQWTERWGELKVSVNVPTLFLEQADCVGIVQSSQNLWGKDHITLCLEILESSFINNISSCFDTLKLLQETGVEISIDDFGTGYSSLSYFKDIPADELKIDKSFVMNLKTDLASKNISELIIDLAHRFDMKVVAEGVEDAETAATLKQYQCDVFQGYYYSRPTPAEEFEKWLEDFVPAI